MTIKNIIYCLDTDDDIDQGSWTEAYAEAIHILKDISQDNRFKDFISEWDKKMKGVGGLIE